MPTVPEDALRAATINTSQPGAWRVRPHSAPCTLCRRPAWSVVLPGLRNACEATARGITRGEGRRPGRRRARACTAKRAVGGARSGWARGARQRRSAGARASTRARKRRRARAGGSGRSALSPGRTSPSPFAPTTSATGLTLHYILTAKNFRIVKIVRIYEETTMRAPTTVRKCYYGCLTYRYPRDRSLNAQRYPLRNILVPTVFPLPVGLARTLHS